MGEVNACWQFEDWEMCHFPVVGLFVSPVELASPVLEPLDEGPIPVLSPCHETDNLQILSDRDPIPRIESKYALTVTNCCLQFHQFVVPKAYHVFIFQFQVTPSFTCCFELFWLSKLYSAAFCFHVFVLNF